MLATLRKRPIVPTALVNLLAALIIGTIIGYAVTWDLKVALLVVVGLAFLLAFIDRIELGVLFIGLYTPYEEFFLKFVPSDMASMARFGGELFILAMLSAVLLKKMAQGKPFRVSPLDVPLVLFIAWALISAVANETSPLTTILGLRILLRYVLLYYVVIHADFPRETIATFVKLFLVAAAIQMVIGLGTGAIGGKMRAFFMPSRGLALGSTVIVAERHFEEAGVGGFISGAMLNFIHFGTFMTLSWLLALGLRLMGWLRSRWLDLFLLLAFVAVIASFSRQSLLALIAGLIVILLFSGRKKLAFWLVTGAATLVIVASLYAAVTYERPISPGTRALHERWLYAFQIQRLQPVITSNFRLFLILELSKALLSRSPLWGLGPGTFGSALSIATGDPIYRELGVSQWATTETNFVSDVNWVTLLGQFGLIGASFFALMLLSLFNYTRRALHRFDDPLAKGLALGTLGCIAAISIAAFFNPHFEIRPISLYLWLFAAFVIALGQARVTPAKKKPAPLESSP
jgi:hypothetical protein